MLVARLSESAPAHQGTVFLTDRAGYIAGVPHMGLQGLAEGWLLKELGQVHWDLIANSVETPASEWTDRLGRPLYASFVTISLEGRLLAECKLGSVIERYSTLSRLTTTRFFTQHLLRTDGEVGLVAELVSVFVVRSVPGNNHSFQRASGGGTLARGPAATEGKLSILNAYRVAAGNALPHPAVRIGNVAIPVVPATDFNCFGMLYFANYPALADRGAWVVERGAPKRGPRTRRECHYFGNVNADDFIDIDIANLGTEHQIATLARHSDGKRIATIRTAFQPSPTDTP